MAPGPNLCVTPPSYNSCHIEKLSASDERAEMAINHEIPWLSAI